MVCPSVLPVEKTQQELTGSWKQTVGYNSDAIELHGLLAHDNNVKDSWQGIGCIS